MNREGKKSITLNELIECLEKARDEHKDWGDKMVYFDCLHINGYVSAYDDKVLELF